MKLKPDEIWKMVEKEGFNEAWVKSAKLLPKRGEWRKRGRGKPHALFDLVQKLREAFLRLGFDELLNPVIADDAEVYRQYGPEASIILDRCYYLATLPRPDIGLGKKKIDQLRKMKVDVDVKKINKLKTVLREYKRGSISSDDLVTEIASALSIDDRLAMSVVEGVFPEFAKLKPMPSSQILRSHMTTIWFRTLQAIQHRKPLPVQMFSIDLKFRREQQEDASHLKSSFVASCIIMDERVTPDVGKEVLEKILSLIGVKRVRHERKKVTSRYYAPGTEYETYAYSPVLGDWLEVANFGMYSPLALARYRIEYPVLNIGLGVERLGMVIYGENDIRKFAYPQFYKEWELSDEEIAEMVSIEKAPESKEGREVASSIVRVATAHANDSSPCEILVYKGKVLGKKVEVYVYEEEEGVKLLGPAALNQVYVYNGNVVGIPGEGLKEGFVEEVRKRGVKVPVTFLSSIASLAAYEIERVARRGGEGVDVRVKLAKTPSDVNVRIDDVARRYITGKGKYIALKGPVFVGIKARIS